MSFPECCSCPYTRPRKCNSRPLKLVCQHSLSSLVKEAIEIDQCAASDAMEKFTIEKVRGSCLGCCGSSVAKRLTPGYRTMHQERGTRQGERQGELYEVGIDEPCSSIRELGPHGIASLAGTSEALLRTVSQTDLQRLPLSCRWLMVRRNETLHILLPWPLRYSAFQDAMNDTWRTPT